MCILSNSTTHTRARTGVRAHTSDRKPLNSPTATALTGCCGCRCCWCSPSCLFKRSQCLTLFRRPPLKDSGVWSGEGEVLPNPLVPAIVCFFACPPLSSHTAGAAATARGAGADLEGDTIRPSSPESRSPLPLRLFVLGREFCTFLLSVSCLMTVSAWNRSPRRSRLSALERRSASRTLCWQPWSEGNLSSMRGERGGVYCCSFSQDTILVPRSLETVFVSK